MRKSSLIALAVFAAVVIGLAFFQTPVMRTARSYVWSMWVGQVAHLFGLGNINDFQTIIDQNASLRADNARLQAELADYRRLRQQLGSPAYGDLRAIPAAVIARPLDTFQSKYVLNKGLKQGLALNAPVVVNGSVLTGFISEISEDSAVMSTLFSPSTQITVEIINPDAESVPARGLLQSRHYTSLSVTTIPRDANIKQNQTVVTVAKDKDLPYGLVVGSVSSMTTSEQDAYQEARLSVPYDADSIDGVHVLVLP